MTDKFISMTLTMVKTQDKLIKKALEMYNYARVAELESFKNGLLQALANYEITRNKER